MSFTRQMIGIALIFSAAAEAADPPAPPAADKPAQAASAARPPLKLQIGDVRKYMMPNEYRAAVGAPDADKYTVVVEGQRELLPMKFEKPVPVGIVTPFWMLANPLSAWRALVPDLRAPPPGPPDPVPQREFRWGP
ncbi:MAG TPA: hypothetical protein VFO82_13025 [Steroidobacteraceae bacterium]|nr:hypothetical protein [Steroidobacteraceae bacterium]